MYSSAVEHTWGMWQAYCSRKCANNVKCTPCHIVDCSELIRGICTDIFASYLHMD